MNITITGKEIKATDAIKEYIEKKAERLVKYFGDEIDANVTIKTEGSEQVAQMDVKIGTDRFRAVTAHKDLYASIDLVVEKLERQIRKNKTRIKERKVKDIPVINFEAIIEEEPKTTIVKRKSVEMKPMDEEEAVLQMELLGHEFFVFQDIDTDSISVLYKRKDGNYGIIETK